MCQQVCCWCSNLSICVPSVLYCYVCVTRCVPVPLCVVLLCLCHQERPCPSLCCTVMSVSPGASLSLSVLYCCVCVTRCVPVPLCVVLLCLCHQVRPCPSLCCTVVSVSPGASLSLSVLYCCVCVTRCVPVPLCVVLLCLCHQVRPCLSRVSLRVRSRSTWRRTDTSLAGPGTHSATVWPTSTLTMYVLCLTLKFSVWRGQLCARVTCLFWSNYVLL